MQGELRIIREVILVFYRNHFETKSSRQGWYEYTSLWDKKDLREFRKICAEQGMNLKLNLTNKKLVLTLTLTI